MQLKSYVKTLLLLKNGNICLFKNMSDFSEPKSIAALFQKFMRFFLNNKTGQKKGFKDLVPMKLCSIDFLEKKTIGNFLYLRCL